MYRARHVLRGVLVVGMLVVTAACGSDSKDAKNSDTTASSKPKSTSADAVQVTAIDYGYDKLPATAKPGTKFELHNGSEKELHEMVAFRLPDDETRSVADLVKLPEAELEALFAGPPAIVILAEPGKDGTNAVGNGALTEPGRYIVFCAIPVGADPAEYLAAAQQSGDGPPQVDGGPPHFTEGMYAEVVVE